MADEEKMDSLTEKRESVVPATPEEEKKLVRKLDRSILPITCLLYLLACRVTISFPSPFEAHAPPIDLDRTNLGNARLQGLPQKVLGGDPTGLLYEWIFSAFYFSYVRP